MPKISVVVPVYNVESYLRNCIDSILNQTFSDLELLLVDDGSTDCSGAICDEYAQKDSRVRVFHSANQGVSAARNFGMDNVRTDWFCFIDSDDWVEPAYIETFLKYPLDREDVLLIQGYVIDNMMLFNREDTNFRQVFPLENISTQNLFPVLKMSLPSWGKLYNINLIRRNMIKFPIDLSINEDQIFNWLYVKHISEVQYSSACLYHWCIHRTSSLCWKFHPSEEYVRGFDIQCRTLSSILNKYSVNDVQLLKDIYTNLIQWLVIAFRNANSENYDFVFDYIRSKKNLLNQYYVPPTLFKRIFKYGFVYLNIPNKLLFRLVENVRKFI